MTGRTASDNPYTLAAAPVFAFIEEIEGYVAEGEHRLIKHALARLDAFSATIERSDMPAAATQPARYALAALIDQNMRQHPKVKLSTWDVLAHQRLFDGRTISPARIAEFRSTARDAGEDFAPLAAFLEQLERRSKGRGILRRRSASRWGLVAFACIALFVVALTGYALWLEYRFHTRIIAGFREDEIAIGLDRDPTGAELASRLGQMRASVERVQRAASFAPLRRALRLPRFDSETVALNSYAEAVNRLVPPALVEVLETEIATQGDGLKLYDALRVWAILAGDTDWQPGYVQSWLEDTQTGLGWHGFAAHVQALDGAIRDLVPTDTEVMDQARSFAAETSEADRVWLELKRGDGVRDLPVWTASQAVPGVEDVLLRGSGLPLDTPVTGLFSSAGWDYARDFGTGIAVQTARQLAPIVLGRDAVQANDTPDQVQDRLHLETIRFWQDWLADIRVQPFTTRDRAILVSGALAQRRNPLTTLLQEIWTQSGGTDRGRSHPQQIQLATSFGPMIQYVETGGIAQVARLFSGLNVALGSVDIDAARGAKRLMSVQDRARSINVLQNAPRIVVQITEDVLAQASVARNEARGSNSLTSAWQRDIYPLCRAAVEGRFPFANGPDAAPVDVAALLGPSGALPQFFQSYAADFVDRSETPWRWKPEARFAGLDPSSAAFFERAIAISGALFDPNGQMQTDMTLTALAERGATTIALGGVGASVRATGQPAQLNWPGPEPARGVQVSFRETGQAAEIDQPGFWGLHRMLDTQRLRFRDGGQRVLVDLRTDEGRVFIEMSLTQPNNPVSGRGALRGFVCPPTL